MPSRVARMRLAQAVGSQFDTEVVLAFEAILAGREHGTQVNELYGDLRQQIPPEVPRAASAAS